MSAGFYMMSRTIFVLWVWQWRKEDEGRDKVDIHIIIINNCCARRESTQGCARSARRANATRRHYASITHSRKQLLYDPCALTLSPQASSLPPNLWKALQHFERYLFLHSTLSLLLFLLMSSSCTHLFLWSSILLHTSITHTICVEPAAHDHLNELAAKLHISQKDDWYDVPKFHLSHFGGVRTKRLLAEYPILNNNTKHSSLHNVYNHWPNTDTQPCNNSCRLPTQTTLGIRHSFQEIKSYQDKSIWLGWWRSCFQVHLLSSSLLASLYYCSGSIFNSSYQGYKSYIM